MTSVCSGVCKYRLNKYLVRSSIMRNILPGTTMNPAAYSYGLFV